MKIRVAESQDFEKLYELTKVAFQTAEVSDGDEQDYAVGLRAGENYIPELDLVCEDNGEIIGQVILTRFPANGAFENVKTLLLGPISVKLECRNQKIGSKLIGEACRIATSLGYGAVLLAGNPKYYNRFGFFATTHFGVKNSNGYPDEVIMVKELWAGSLAGLSGTFTFC